MNAELIWDQALRGLVVGTVCRDAMRSCWSASANATAALELNSNGMRVDIAFLSAHRQRAGCVAVFVRECPSSHGCKHQDRFSQPVLVIDPRDLDERLRQTSLRSLLALKAMLGEEAAHRLSLTLKGWYDEFLARIAREDTKTGRARSPAQKERS